MFDKNMQHIEATSFESYSFTYSEWEALFPRSVWIYKDIVVVWGHSPVFAVVVLLWEIFLVIGEEGIELDALFEVLDSFHASDLL